MELAISEPYFYGIHGGDKSLPQFMVVYSYTLQEFYDNEWQDERDSVLDDMKNKFRQTQIEEEGNDPILTGESFGTPHDIASLHVSKRNAGVEAEPENVGRPQSGGSAYGTDAHIFGRDPIGSTAFKPAIDLSVKENVNKSNSKDAAKRLGFVTNNHNKSNKSNRST